MARARDVADLMWYRRPVGVNDGRRILDRTELRWKNERRRDRVGRVTNGDS